MGKLVNYSVGDFDNVFEQDTAFSDLTSADKISAINLAMEWTVDFLNSIGKEDYRFDSFMDADLVLAPSASEFASQYDDYILITIGADNSITANTTTAVNFSLSDSSHSSDGSYETYVLTISGGDAIASKTLVDASIYGASWEKNVSANTITILANNGHGEFVIEIKNPKVA